MEITRYFLAAIGVEALLLTATLLLVIQPKFLFAGDNEQVQKAIAGFGWFVFLLCFCWSFVLGAMITLREVSQTL